MLTKEEHIKSHNRISKGYYTNEDVLNYKKLIKEHFELVKDFMQLDKDFEQLEKSYDNLYDKFHNLKPFKFEELKPNMWVWDNKTKSYIFIFKPLNWEPTKGIRYANMIIYHSAEGYYMDFEENRFFRYEVKE